MAFVFYILKRLVWAFPTLLAVSLIGFTLMRYDFDFGTWHVPNLAQPGQTITLNLHFKNPIDPLAELRNNPQISPATVEAERQRLGLDQPMHIQYWRWLKHFFTVDTQALEAGHWWAAWRPNLGTSFSGEDVFTQLALRARNTLLLNGLVILLTWLVALPLGVWAALRWRTWGDRAMTLFSSVGMAAPTFVVALIFAVICVRTGWLPVGGLTSAGFAQFSPGGKLLDMAAHLLLPVLVLSFAGVASLQRQMRGNLLDVLQAEYVRMARAKGLPENKVIYKHAVRTAINPLITLLGYELAALLSGSLLVEMIINYPGLGQYTYQAVLQTDTNVVMASLVLSATLLVVGNLLADILLSVADPRITLQGAKA